MGRHNQERIPLKKNILTALFLAGCLVLAAASSQTTFARYQSARESASATLGETQFWFTSNLLTDSGGTRTQALESGGDYAFLLFNYAYPSEAQVTDRDLSCSWSARAVSGGAIGNTGGNGVLRGREVSELVCSLGSCTFDGDNTPLVVDISAAALAPFATEITARLILTKANYLSDDENYGKIHFTLNPGESTAWMELYTPHSATYKNYIYSFDWAGGWCITPDLTAEVFNGHSSSAGALTVTLPAGSYYRIPLIKGMGGGDSSSRADYYFAPYDNTWLTIDKTTSPYSYLMHKTSSNAASYYDAAFRVFFVGKDSY